jgi:TatD DNase family protein
VFFHTKNLAAKCPYLLPAAGLHPELVHSHGHQIDQLLPLLQETRYVGEIGLDYTTSDDGLRQQQRKVFEQIVGTCGSLGDRVLTIHSRRAAADVIAIIGERFNGKAILHWFTGTKREADRALAAGCYFSINSAMTKAKSSQAIIAQLPVDRLLTETDGPFVRNGATPSTPANVLGIIKELSKLKGCAEEELREQIMRTFRSL